MSEFFDPGAGEIAAGFPAHWQTDSGELGLIITALGAEYDLLAAVVEQIHADQALSTATADGLAAEWAVLYGAQSEQLPPTVGALRSHLQALAADDGSLGALREALLALLRIPANDEGTQLVFPADGSGLIFPADGSGLTMFEATEERPELVFPADGSEIAFPAGNDGTIMFPQAGRVEFVERQSEPRLEVKVREVLVFDRAAFARAVQRARMAHHLPPIVTEVL